MYARLCKKAPTLNLFHEHNIDDNFECFLIHKYGLSSKQVNFMASLITSLLSTTSILLFKVSQILCVLMLVCTFIMFYYMKYTFKEEYLKNSRQLISLIPVIKTYLSLFEISLPADYNRSLAFLRLIKQLDLNVIEPFSIIAQSIERGKSISNTINQEIGYYNSFASFIQSYLEKGIDFNFEYGQNLINRYKEFTGSLETRLSILFFLCVFFPLGLNLGIVFGMLDVYTLLIAAVLFFILMKLLNSKVVNEETLLLGIHDENASIIREEYNKTLEFIIDLARFLKYNSKERSLLLALDRSVDFQLISNEITGDLNLYRTSVSNFFKITAKKLKSEQARLLLGTIERLLVHNARGTSFRLDDLIIVLKKHQDLEKERESILKSQNVKRLILLMLIPLINGILVSIIPVIQSLFKLSSTNFQGYFSSFSVFAGNYKTLSPVFSILFEVVILLIIFYYFTHSFERKYKIFGFLLMFGVFFVSFLISNLLLLIQSGALPL